MGHEGSKNDDFRHVMPKRNTAGLIRSRISEANNSYLYPSVDEGKQTNIELEKFPKEFFEGNMKLKDKINLVLNDKSISFSTLANTLKLSDDKLKIFIDKEKLPKSILKRLADYSGYPMEFFKCKSLESLLK